MDASPELARLLRERKDPIIARWIERVRAHPIARRLSDESLIDSMPVFLDRIAENVARGETRAHEIANVAAEHGSQRLDVGYEIGQLVGEYVDLREAIHDALADAMSSVPQGAWRTMNSAIDNAVRDVMNRFNAARAKKLHALERLSSEPFTAHDLDSLMARLVDVMSEVAPEVDTATILLREGNTLRVRASRGLEDDMHRGFCVAMGQGFAGTIGEKREAIYLNDATHDPLVTSDAIRKHGVKALYGVPLIDDRGELVGVAHMGSMTAHEFQTEDLILFRGLANRATALIVSRKHADDMVAEQHQRERFIGILGHDLRSPLGAISMAAQYLLAHANLDDRSRNAAARILRSSQRMARLISDLLDYTRARAGQEIPLTLAWTDLHDLARTTVEEWQFQLPEREVRLTSHMRSRVYCDPDRIAQVLSNLIGNALRHGAPDAPVDVCLEEKGDAVRIRVHNEGPPIPTSLLPFLFEPFRRGATGDASGVGLGLFIARAITTAHGGNIEVQSEHGRGTTFVVLLPRQSEPDAGAPPHC